MPASRVGAVTSRHPQKCCEVVNNSYCCWQHRMCDIASLTLTFCKLPPPSRWHRVAARHLYPSAFVGHPPLLHTTLLVIFHHCFPPFPKQCPHTCAGWCVQLHHRPHVVRGGHPPGANIRISSSRCARPGLTLPLRTQCAAERCRGQQHRAGGLGWWCAQHPTLLT